MVRVTIAVMRRRRTTLQGKDTLSMRSTHDYIVIGGGSAGCVVAGRLSAAGASVLLLEAGGTDRRPDVYIPAGIVSAYRLCNWKFVPEPDRSRGGAVEAWAAGRVLGGGGSINGMIFVRGNHADFDGWAKLGCAGWEYDSVLPYFIRMETWAGGPDDYRGGLGPIAVGYQTMDHPANDAFLAAAEEAGHPRLLDYNGRDQEGAAPIQVNQRRGLRSHSSREYLRRVGRRDTLTVRTGAFVRRVVFEARRAVSVEYEHRGKHHVAYAGREIILSAGSLVSPKILMVSGVGPRHELERHGIPVVQDSGGVGANLQEHLGVFQRWHSTVPTINHIGVGEAARSVWEYARHGTGTLTTSGWHAQVIHRATEDRDAPDIQNAFSCFAIVRDRGKDGIMKVGPAKAPSVQTTTVFVKPRQRGRIRLRSADPNDRPVIEHQMMANADDVRDLLIGMAEARRIMGQSSMAEFVAEPFDPERACRSSEDWEAFARENVTYGVHPVGTCKMGVDEDAVVDPELRVHGVAGLRVVDASIMPTTTTGNTNAPTMMIAEKAVDLLLSS
jgi:choline dehydrogenase